MGLLALVGSDVFYALKRQKKKKLQEIADDGHGTLDTTDK